MIECGCVISNWVTGEMTVSMCSELEFEAAMFVVPEPVWGRYYGDDVYDDMNLSEILAISI